MLVSFEAPPRIRVEGIALAFLESNREFLEMANDPVKAAGQCHWTSRIVRDWASERGEAVRLILGRRLLRPLGWGSPWGNWGNFNPWQAAHVVFSVDGACADLTARQFFPAAEVPRVQTMAQFSEEWGEVTFIGDY